MADKHAVPPADAIIALYSAERADGSAIFGVTMNLMAVTATYGGLVVAAISTGFFSTEGRGPWLQAFIGVPLWGLLCYHYVILCLVLVRTNSIRLLEHTLLEAATPLTDMERAQIGSDAGDWITNVNRQPGSLRPASLAAYISLTFAVIVVNVVSVWLVLPRNTTAFALGIATHLVFAARLATIVTVYLTQGEAMIDRLSRGRWRSESRN